MPRRTPDRLPALTRMRRYVTGSFVALVAFMAVFYVAALTTEGAPAWLVVAVVAVSVAVAAHSVFWERGAPWWLATLSLASSAALWWAAHLAEQNLTLLLFFGVSVGLVTTTPPFTSWRWLVAAVGVAVGPLLVAGPGARPVVLPVSIAVVVVTLAAIYLVYRLNRYGFDLYLEIEAARETTAELAVVRERYRFSVDLHDIQGQALHVSRLQLQLADKTLDRDPAEARRHLREAEQLIVQTIAETRRLAYGQRTLTLAGELANSTELIRAASIDLVVDGAPPVGHPADDLFGHAVREATTNLLRHAQAEHVTIRLRDDTVVVENDGAGEAPRLLSGLARLGERFAEIGGSVTTSHHDGVFRLEARAASAGAGGLAGATRASSAPGPGVATGGRA
ncbi:histidine kinase [Frigoribacterium faeni]|uniref:sensor histidine kinase n=1 Tax=Frigoribacterium faeni TaxID=145483 RepID=UPI001FADD95C|nr:histidine kinase [Frigoribacterium faeni]MCJ0702409.1 histidine kinase [Frigoribacterium faeni]